MEKDAPVVGPDAPTANSKMVKLDIATADWSRPTFGLRVTHQNNRNFAILSLMEWAIRRQEPPGEGSEVGRLCPFASARRL